MPLPYWVFFLMLSSLLGCGGPEVKEEPLPPPPPPPTRIELSIKADANINPDASNRASPLLLRVYELKDQASFNSADFFALYGKEQETLGGDLLRKQELTLVPGGSKSLSFEAEPATRFLAVFAAFRKLEAAQWRASAGVPPAQTTVIDVNVNGDQISLSAKQKPVATKIDATQEKK